MILKTTERCASIGAVACQKILFDLRSSFRRREELLARRNIAGLSQNYHSSRLWYEPYSRSFDDHPRPDIQYRRFKKNGYIMSRALALILFLCLYNVSANAAPSKVYT